MQRLKNRIWGLVPSGFILIFLMSCVGEAVNIDLPQNHPANPQARETVLIPPPNPFQNHTEMKSGSGSTMNEKKQPPSHQHHMTHEMDQMSKDSMPKPEAGKEKKDHQH